MDLTRRSATDVRVNGGVAEAPVLQRLPASQNLVSSVRSVIPVRLLQDLRHLMLGFGAANVHLPLWSTLKSMTKPMKQETKRHARTASPSPAIPAILASYGRKNSQTRVSFQVSAEPLHLLWTCSSDDVAVVQNSASHFVPSQLA